MKDNVKDNTSQVVEDIKWALFNDRNFETTFNFETWAGDGNSFIVKDNDGQEYCITVTKEG